MVVTLELPLVKLVPLNSPTASTKGMASSRALTVWQSSDSELIYQRFSVL